MLNKSEKKYFFTKILLVVVLVFFVAMAFIQPKPNVQHVEKPFTVNAQ